MPESAPATMLAHMVYFALHENTPAARQNLIAECKKYLSGHPGTVLFAVGTPADYARDVNVRDFDVALQLVFRDRASHDAYQVADRHKQFVEQNRAGWKNVRVFDADVQGA